MRTLSRYIILSYIGPFAMTFLISVFVLFLQFLWKYVDDLIGKGLEMSVLAELFFYAALSMFPLALPLAILLSSLMTFGNLGEHFELVALKSAGLSLQKIMLPLVAVACLTSVGAFLFSNNFLPYINLKMNSLIYDIQQKKPALNIKEGVFYNGIEGYTIRIEHKDDDEITCHGIMIYDHTQNQGNTKVLNAKSGKIQLSEDKQFLTMVLFDGTSYEEVTDKDNEEVFPLVRSKFREQTVRFDLSGFRLVRSEEELFKSSYSMLNIGQISRAIDTLRLEKKQREANFRERLSEALSEKNIFKTLPDSAIPAGVQSRMATPAAVPGAHVTKAQTIDMALNLARTKKYLIENIGVEKQNCDRPIMYLSVEWHKKFSMSLACLILFFVGAPLGAIIRKGGLGMPVVVSVIMFILFWVISITGEKMSKEEVIPPYIGMWIATAVILPLGIFLTRKATSDSALFDTDSYLAFFQKIFRKKGP